MLSWYELREYPDGVEFQLRAPTGGLLLSSPRVKTVEHAIRQIKLVQNLCNDPLSCDRRTNERWEPYFAIIGESRDDTLAVSPAFESQVSREYAIESVRVYGKSEDVRAVVGPPPAVGFP